MAQEPTTDVALVATSIERKAGGKGTVVAGTQVASVHGDSYCASTEQGRGKEGNREERVVEKNGEQVSALALHYTDVSEEARARV